MEEPKKKAKKGMKLHHFIATGGKPSEFKGMQGEIQSAQEDEETVGIEKEEKEPK